MGGMKDLFGDIPWKSEGDRLRDEGTALVASNNREWIANGLYAIRTKIPSGTILMGEEIRLWFHEEPKSQNAWGALTRTATLHGLLVETGEVRKSKRDKAHSRRNPVYRRT